MILVDHSILDFKENARVNGELIEAIDDGLTAFNQATYPDPNAAPITLAMENDEGILVAGLTGRNAYGWMRVDVVWVDESQRGLGLGAKLLARAEQIAIERGCHGIHLDTHGFQAPKFYEKSGYESFGSLERYPAEHSHIYYQKVLA